MTNAIYETDFNSSSHLYTRTNDILGTMTSPVHTGAAETDIFFAIAKCSLGTILVAQSKKGICSILIGDDPVSLVQELQDQFPKVDLGGDGHEEIVAKVVGMMEKPGMEIDLPLDIRGTAFQKRVWTALQQIPSGSTATYTEIAEKIGMPKAVRAVAQACASNVLAVAIPCHRVIRADGSLSGYRWGVERKSALLEREAHA